MKNNFVFFGSPEFAAEILKNLINNGIKPKAVITNPDRPQGRKMALFAPPAKLVAEENKIPVAQPENISLEEIKRIGTDFGVVAAYSKILKREILEAFPKGILGIHPSLLPKWRGASPIQNAILAGDKETGVSIYLMDEKMDHGPILAQKKVAISDSDDYFSLEKKLAGAGAELFRETIPKYLEGTMAPLPQDESLATFTKKFKTEDGFISQEELEAAQNGQGAEIIYNKIRALSAEPVAWTLENSKRVKLLVSKVQNGKLVLLRTQREGGKPHDLISRSKW